MFTLEEAPVSERRTKAMLKEMVRRAVAEMINRHEAPLSEQESVALVDGFTKQRGQIGRAQRAGDWSLATQLASPTAEATGVPLGTLSDPIIAREVLAMMRRVLDLSIQVESDFDDPLDAGRKLLSDVGLPAKRSALRPPMKLTEAIKVASAEAPRDVEKKIAAVGRLALAYFGDIPVASITFDRAFDFIHFIWMMPRDWGRAHGRNRFNSVGVDLDPVQEQKEADRRDAALVAAILADDTLSRPDRRQQLVEGLTPRLTDGYLMVQRDMLNRIFRAALGTAATGRDLDDADRAIPSHKQIKSRMHAWRKALTTPCGLPMRVSRPKQRRVWSLEHVRGLLLSPIYRGTASKTQRWRRPNAKKRYIQRDAIYWVPLFMITMGVRPEEILQLKLRNVRVRDGQLCVFLGEDGDDLLKSAQSRRIIPVAQMLLDLGFKEWVRAKIAAKQVWAFPEVEPDASHDRRSQIFGDRLRTLLKNLKLHCNDEDIYAMRRTLSSKLLNLGVDRGVRQRVLGHLEGTTIDRHYSEDGLTELKALLDAVDYNIVIGDEPGLAFPTIVGASSHILPAAEVTAALGDDSELTAVRVMEPDTERCLVEAHIEGRPVPKGKEWADVPSLPAQSVAEALNSLFTTHNLAMPDFDERLAAVEHLLILAGPRKATPHSFSETLDPPTSAEEKREASVADEDGWNERSDAWSQEVAAGAGQVLVCVFPDLRNPRSGGSLRPGIVVNVRELSGKRYFDVAYGAPAEGVSREHELDVASTTEIEAAKLKVATRFNLRRRVLIAEDNGQHLKGHLGKLPLGASTRLHETLGRAGDVSPTPVTEKTAKSGPVIEYKSAPRKRVVNKVRA